MSLRPILRWPDPRLSEVCAPVETFDEDLTALADDMLETMYEAPGRGLAAPQVGVMQRLFVMDVAWKDGEPEPIVCVNPEIVSRAGEATGPEGCLSIPGVTAEVTRSAEITLRWQALDGSIMMRAMRGFAAICAQHELDHLDGRVTFDRLEPDARAALEAEYAAL